MPESVGWSGTSISLPTSSVLTSSAATSHPTLASRLSIRRARVVASSNSSSLAASAVAFVASASSSLYFLLSRGCLLAGRLKLLQQGLHLGFLGSQFFENLASFARLLSPAAGPACLKAGISLSLSVAVAAQKSSARDRRLLSGARAHCRGCDRLSVSSLVAVHTQSVQFVQDDFWCDRRESRILEQVNEGRLIRLWQAQITIDVL